MNPENYINKHNNDIESFDDVATLNELVERIKTPEELLSFMDKNIKYGYVGSDSKKIYTWKDERFNEDFDREYFLQSPEELLISKRGVCWDQVELERYWFNQKKLEAKTYFLNFAKEDSNLPTHTLLVYKNDNKFYWFENSFANNRGIHEYESIDSLLSDAKQKQFEYAKKNNGASNDDFETIKITRYNTPDYGLSVDEYMGQFFK